MPKFILKITAESAENCIDEKNVECFILSASLPEDCLGRIIRKIEAAGKIALLEGEDAAALAVKLGADGIVADLSASTAIKKEMAALRRQLGRRFLGVICRSRRHEAMIVSENEPDFVVFRIWSEGAEKTKALADWYAEFFLLQTAVEPMDGSVNFSAWHADMVSLSPEEYKILVAKK